MDQPYPPIAEYGVIGDTRTAALVSRDGSIDWLCLPRFDSASFLGALLDRDRGGYLRVAPLEWRSASRRYLPETNVLETAYQVAGVPRDGRPTPVEPLTVAGPLCTGLDVFCGAEPLPLPEPGDLVVIHDAGAYGFSQSMPLFLSHPLPAQLVLAERLSEVAAPAPP